VSSNSGRPRRKFAVRSIACHDGKDGSFEPDSFVKPQPSALLSGWAAAEWAIRFYRRHGFELVPPEQKTALLRTYWTVSDRQIENSVVLTKTMAEAAS